MKTWVKIHADKMRVPFPRLVNHYLEFQLLFLRNFLGNVQREEDHAQHDEEWKV